MLWSTRSLNCSSEYMCQGLHNSQSSVHHRLKCFRFLCLLSPLILLHVNLLLVHFPLITHIMRSNCFLCCSWPNKPIGMDCSCSAAHCSKSNNLVDIIFLRFLPLSHVSQPWLGVILTMLSPLASYPIGELGEKDNKRYCKQAHLTKSSYMSYAVS